MAKPPSPDFAEIARRVRKNRRRDTHVAMPLPPDRPRVARPLEPVATPGRVVDAIEITKVFNLDDLQGREEGTDG